MRLYEYGKWTVGLHEDGQRVHYTYWLGILSPEEADRRVAKNPLASHYPGFFYKYHGNTYFRGAYNQLK